MMGENCSVQDLLQPSDEGDTLGGMLLAQMICSDVDCTDEDEAFGTAAETDFVLCPGCGCLMVAVCFEETEEDVRPSPVVLGLAA